MNDRPKCSKCGHSEASDNGWCMTGRPFIANRPDSNQRSICACKCEFPSTTERVGVQGGERSDYPSPMQIQNQAENILCAVFGFPPSAVIGRHSPALVERITAALTAAYKSGVPEADALTAAELRGQAQGMERAVEKIDAHISERLDRHTSPQTSAKMQPCSTKENK